MHLSTKNRRISTHFPTKEREISVTCPFKFRLQLFKKHLPNTFRPSNPVASGQYGRPSVPLGMTPRQWIQGSLHGRQERFGHGILRIIGFDQRGEVVIPLLGRPGQEGSDRIKGDRIHGLL